MLWQTQRPGQISPQTKRESQTTSLLTARLIVVIWWVELLSKITWSRITTTRQSVERTSYLSGFQEATKRETNGWEKGDKSSWRTAEISTGGGFVQKRVRKRKTKEGTPAWRTFPASVPINDYWGVSSEPGSTDTGSLRFLFFFEFLLLFWYISFSLICALYFLGVVSCFCFVLYSIYLFLGCSFLVPG